MLRFLINPVRSVSDLEAILLLFNAYASSLTVDLAYQDFSRELADMPGKYAPPAGELLLARDARNGEAMGCVGLRPLETNGCCEMKRLYVAPHARGIALGKALVSAVIQEATRIGYREIRLDTMPTMIAAIALYRQAGFVEIDAYYDTPVGCTTFMAQPLG